MRAVESGLWVPVVLAAVAACTEEGPGADAHGGHPVFGDEPTGLSIANPTGDSGATSTVPTGTGGPPVDVRVVHLLDGVGDVTVDLAGGALIEALNWSGSTDAAVGGYAMVPSGDVSVTVISASAAGETVLDQAVTLPLGGGPYTLLLVGSPQAGLVDPTYGPSVVVVSDVPDQAPGLATVQVVHTAWGYGDISARSGPVTLLEALPYASSSGPLQAPAGALEVAVSVDGDDSDDVFGLALESGTWGHVYVVGHPDRLPQSTALVLHLLGYPTQVVLP